MKQQDSFPTYKERMFLRNKLHQQIGVVKNSVEQLQRIMMKLIAVEKKWQQADNFFLIDIPKQLQVEKLNEQIDKQLIAIQPHLDSASILVKQSKISTYVKAHLLGFKTQMNKHKSQLLLIKQQHEKQNYQLQKIKSQLKIIKEQKQNEMQKIIHSRSELEFLKLQKQKQNTYLNNLILKKSMVFGEFENIKMVISTIKPSQS